jgi:shikimate dehydrogenase
MSMNARLDQYAVAGNPIGHSKSPVIHTLFAEQTGQRLEYRAMLVEPGSFVGAVDEFRRAGGRGLNVTVPFKQDAWVYAEVLSPRAERAKAVNTLVFREDGGVLGENTDGLGLVRDITVNHGGRVRGRHVLLLGAGGAARGVLQPLLAEQPRALVVANRTASKARELALLFGDLGQVSGCGFTELGDACFDLIINATSAGLNDAILPLPDRVVGEGVWCYDMMYGDRPTAFVRWAHRQGAAKVLDGLGMLVEQAAESFLLWRGIRPETSPVLAVLRGD